MKKIIFVLFGGVFLLWVHTAVAAEFPVVLSISDYKINPSKYDEISDPDVYFEIVYNGDVIETSKPIRDNNFHSYGEMKPLGDYCQGISGLAANDKVIIKFYDADYDANLVKRFWEWIQTKLYKYIAYFGKQVELMNDNNKRYDDYDALKAAKENPELKRQENNLTSNVMMINNKRNNRKELEYIGEAEINADQAVRGFQAGKPLQAASYKIKNTKKGNTIGKVNVVIKRFDGFGASLQVKGY